MSDKEDVAEPPASEASEAKAGTKTEFAGFLDR